MLHAVFPSDMYGKTSILDLHLEIEINTVWVYFIQVLKYFMRCYINHFNITHII